MTAATDLSSHILMEWKGEKREKIQMGAFQDGSAAQGECYSEKSHGEQELVACGRDLSTDKGDRKVGQSAGWGMLFSAVAADPMLGKHGRRGEVEEGGALGA